MQQRAAACSMGAILVLAWFGLFESFGLAAGLAVIGIIAAPFLIFVAAIPTIVRQSLPAAPEE